MAGGIHNVDLGIAVHDGSVFGKDGDPALPLQIVGVHDPLGHLFVGAEHAALPQQLIHQRGLSMIDVGDDGDIAKVFSLSCLSHKLRSFLLIA